MYKNYIHYLSIILIISPLICNATDQEQIDALRQAAITEIAKPEEANEKEEIFNSGALGLQSLNPEISVVGDIAWRYQPGIL